MTNREIFHFYFNFSALCSFLFLMLSRVTRFRKRKFKLSLSSFSFSHQSTAELELERMASAISPETIRELWLDTNFPGHGMGLISFKQELESHFNVKFSDKYVKNILTRIPDYVQNIIRRKRIERRNYDSVHGFLELMQADLAEFPEYPKNSSEKGWRYVFCAIDTYTSFLWTQPLREKTSETVQKAFDRIFDEYGTPQKLECDRAGELIRLDNQGYFRGRKIYLHFKRPPNKAAFIENAIFQLKRKVYLELRRTGSNDWPSLITQLTKNFNERKHESLGGLRPIDLNSKEKAVRLDQFTPKKEATFEENQEFKRQNLESTSIKVNDYVFAYVPKKRPRGFEVQVTTISDSNSWFKK